MSMATVAERSGWTNSDQEFLEGAGIANGLGSAALSRPDMGELEKSEYCHTANCCPVCGVSHGGICSVVLGDSQSGPDAVLELDTITWTNVSHTLGAISTTRI